MPRDVTFLFAALLGVIMMTTANEGSASSTAVTNAVREVVLKSTRAYENPCKEAETSLEFISPSGEASYTAAFWDGGDVWRARFSPTVAGRWRWTSKCSDAKNDGLHGRSGSFDCSANKRVNTLVDRGPVRLSANRRHFIHSDGTPFFWLADTAWNGVLKARDSDWDKYLEIRRRQGFTAVQFVATHWRAFDGEAAYTGEKDIRINPDFFKRLDAKVKAINDHGLVAAPVVLWAYGDGDPGHDLGEEDAIRVAKYIVARWDAYNVFWILAGDGNYRDDRADRWKRIGQAVFGDHPTRPATMHPGGIQWVAEAFGREPWYSMVGYQSGHSARGNEWLVEGPPAKDWDTSPVLPVVNLEPNYEAIAYGRTTPFDALAVRQALYRSLLVSPTAGVTYGHHGIWSWAEKPEVPLAHENTGVAPPWYQAVKSEGADSVKQLSRFFRSIRWWTLMPDPTLLIGPKTSPAGFIASARNDEGTLALVYLPDGGEVLLNTKELKLPAGGRWFKPSTGRYSPVGTIAGDSAELRAPGDGDWVLVIGK